MDDDVGARDAGDDRFYVKSLTLENFRCFERLELRDLDPQFNLLVGENGSGKSSVLHALACSFQPIANFPVGGAMGPELYSADVRNLHSFNISTPPMATEATVSVSARWFGEDFLRDETVTARGLVESRRASGSPIKIREREAQIFPVIAVFTTSRQFLSNFSLIEKTKPQPLNRWKAFQNWSNAGTTSDELRIWLKDETLLAFETDRGSMPTALSLVRHACARAIDGAIEVSYMQSRRDIVVKFEYGPDLAFSTLSDGQRALVGLIAEVARRACVLNFELLGEKCLTETPGLVLIDEIDLHLHPKWQRQIVDALKRIFPKIQFFATTHSPQVIGEARAEEIVLLTKDGQQKRPPQSYGMDSNWILECVIEAEGRDPAIAKRIKSLFKLIDDDRFAEAKVEIANLREIIDSDPEVVAAESYIWNLEHAPDEAAE